MVRLARGLPTRETAVTWLPLMMPLVVTNFMLSFPIRRIGWDHGLNCIISYVCIKSEFWDGMSDASSPLCKCLYKILRTR